MRGRRPQKEPEGVKVGTALRGDAGVGLLLPKSILFAGTSWLGTMYHRLRPGI